MSIINIFSKKGLRNNINSIFDRCESMKILQNHFPTRLCRTTRPPNGASHISSINRKQYRDEKLSGPLANKTEDTALHMAILTWYLLFGALHEVSHVLAAAAIGIGNEVSVKDILLAVLGRGVIILGLSNADPVLVMIIRHSGWISSILLGLVVHLIHSRTHSAANKWINSARSAAWITAAEAISTDLLGFGLYGTLSSSTFLCGNFGIILINPLWTESSQSSKQVLDLLAKMINVTMMRGAQTGGVIAWAKNDNNEIYGIRSRVVNGKRIYLKVSKTKLSKTHLPTARLREVSKASMATLALLLLQRLLLTGHTLINGHLQQSDECISGMP